MMTTSSVDSGGAVEVWGEEEGEAVFVEGGGGCMRSVGEAGDESEGWTGEEEVGVVRGVDEGRTEGEGEEERVGGLGGFIGSSHELMTFFAVGFAVFLLNCARMAAMSLRGAAGADGGDGVAVADGLGCAISAAVTAAAACEEGEDESREGVAGSSTTPTGTLGGSAACSSARCPSVPSAAVSGVVELEDGKG